jgi:putative PIG3 family NAD(P)H quinone oxidoreductase
MPETFFTVWTNLFERGRLEAGETVLIHGGSSGIGTTAIQLAHVRGARVLATAGSQAKCDACRRLGADVAINYREEDFVLVAREVTEGGGVDVILDMVGGSYFSRNLTALAMEGRLVQIAFMTGSRVEVDLQVMMTKRLTLTGSTLRPRTVAQKAAIARELERHVWPEIASRAVHPVVHRTFPLADAAGAHRLLEEGSVIGKLVLTT